MNLKNATVCIVAAITLVCETSPFAQTGNVGIGTTSPDTTLHVVGKLKISDGSQAEGHVLTTDASGMASWQLLTAQNVLKDLPSEMICLSLTGTVGTGPLPISVHVLDNYAYVIDSDDNDLKVIDVGDPANPGVVASMPIGSGPTSIHVLNTYAYVVDAFSDDLKVIDVSNPGSPALAGTVNIGPEPRSVFVQGSHAYVVDNSDSDLKVIDISNPGSPVTVGELTIGSFPEAVYVQEDYAYVVDQGDDALKIVDVSTASNPALSGTIGIGASPNAVHVQGNYAYVVDGNTDDLKVVNVSNPSSPTAAGVIGLGGSPNSVYVQGNYAFVADGTSDDIKVIDVSTPASMVIVGSISLGTSPQSVFVQGSYAYVVDFFTDKLSVVKVLCTPGMIIDPATGDLLYERSRWEWNESDIFSTNTGNVGVGTSSPATKLHLSGGDLRVDRGETTSGLTRTLTIGGARNFLGNPFARIDLQNMDNDNGNIDYVGARIEAHNNTASDGGDLRFYTKSGALTERMIIDESGNIGIGTSSPSENLVVGQDFGSNLTGTRITVGDAGNSSGINVGEDGSNRGWMLWNASNNTLGFGTRSGGLQYSTTLSLTNGEVGINSADTRSMLTLRGPDNINSGPIITLYGDNSDQAESGRIRFVEGTASANWRGGYIHYDGAANRFHIGVHGTSDDNPAQDNNAISINRDNGDVGIGIASPSVALDVSGSIEYTGTITEVSDIRLKENIRPVNNALNRVAALEPCAYNMHDDDSKTREYGLIAQEVQEIFPEVVRVVDEENGYLGVSYIQLVPVLIEAIKEQQEMIKTLVNRLDRQEKIIRLQASSIEAKQSEIAGLQAKQDMISQQQAEIDELKEMVESLMR